MSRYSLRDAVDLISHSSRLLASCGETDEARHVNSTQARNTDAAGDQGPWDQFFESNSPIGSSQGSRPQARFARKLCKSCKMLNFSLEKARMLEGQLLASCFQKLQVQVQISTICREISPWSPEFQTLFWALKIEVFFHFSREEFSGFNRPRPNLNPRSAGGMSSNRYETELCDAQKSGSGTSRHCLVLAQNNKVNSGRFLCPPKKN